MSKSIQYLNVLGTIIINKEKIQFSKVIRATSEAEAERKIFIHYGSKHNVKRQVIKITGIKSVKKEQVEDPIGEELSKSDSFKLLRG